jgi:hypothetical protein
MRKIVQTSVRTLSHALIVLLCIAFGVTGAIPVNQILSAYDQLAAKEKTASPTFFIQANPSDVDAQGDMAPTSRANADQPVITITIQAQSETFRLSESDVLHGDGTLCLSNVSPVTSSELRTTASSISTSLGLQFRLLGEKPSGTS